MAIDLTPTTRIVKEPQLTTTGDFLAGTPAIFFFTFCDINGDLFDSPDITITISDSAGTAVKNATAADRVEKGRYAFGWDIPIDQDPGLYTFRVDYDVEQTTGTTSESFTQKFVISEVDIGVIDGRGIAFRSFLESLIGYTQRIPVFHEIGRLNAARTTADFSFPLWNQPAKVKLFINGEPKTTGFEVNYLEGEIEFNNALASVDEVTASYNFRWFKDSEIDSFLAESVQFFNQYPPQSVFSLGSLPTRYAVTVTHQAAVFCLRRLIMDLHFQEPAKVFGGMDRADKLIGSLDSLKKNMEEDLNSLYEQKKYQPYLGLTKTVTVPEFTLPGGRCLAHNSLIAYVVANKELTCNIRSGYSHLNMPTVSPFVYTNEKSGQFSVYTNGYQEGTISEVYNLFNEGSSIDVLSDKDGILSFEPVSHIWDSGIKTLLRIEDEYDNVVEVSNEHIIFVNNKEVPALQVKVGDILTVNLFDSLQRSRVAKITRIKETPTFDIEVPTTENLMVNNIKCHNSRWFRYLFKGA